MFFMKIFCPICNNEVKQFNEEIYCSNCDASFFFDTSTNNPFGGSNINDIFDDLNFQTMNSIDNIMFIEQNLEAIKNRKNIDENIIDVEIIDKK